MKKPTYSSVRANAKIPKKYYQKLKDITNKTGYTQQELISIGLYLLLNKIEQETEFGKPLYTLIQELHTQMLEDVKRKG